uniref:Uncharacterized protein n=1 Tax=Peronospora matthiolae TaxID=2874970 RepID=A0AAV1V3Q7_9STRA
MDGPRQVIVDDQVVKFWSRTAKPAFELGLLVGQVSSSNAGDVMLAVVPIPSESESSDVLTRLDDVSVEWVQEVAQQVDRLLPGGIFVLGLYVVSTRDNASRVVPYLRSTAEAVALHASVTFVDPVHYLAIVSPKGGFELQCWYDVTDVNKARMVSAVLKTPLTNVKFKQYRTLVDMNEPISLARIAMDVTSAATDVADTCMDEVENHLKSLFRRVEESVAVLNVVDDTQVQHMNLLSLTPAQSPASFGDPLGYIRGAISCVAFLYDREPGAKEMAARYLKHDFVKSMLVRVSLARERWAEDSQGKPNAVLQEGGVVCFPQRGLVPWRSTSVLSPHLPATVYVFPDEDAGQAVKDALELLGDDTPTAGSLWIALESGSQPAFVKDQDRRVIQTSEYFQHVYYVLPLVIVILLLFVQFTSIV